jgi:hypothetical protein
MSDVAAAAPAATRWTTTRRLVRIRRALEVLHNRQGGRAEAIQTIFSLEWPKAGRNAPAFFLRPASPDPTGRPRRSNPCVFS